MKSRTLSSDSSDSPDKERVDFRLTSASGEIDEERDAEFCIEIKPLLERLPRVTTIEEIHEQHLIIKKRTGFLAVTLMAFVEQHPDIPLNSITSRMKSLVCDQVWPNLGERDEGTPVYWPEYVVVCLITTRIFESAFLILAKQTDLRKKSLESPEDANDRISTHSQLTVECPTTFDESTAQMIVESPALATDLKAIYDPSPIQTPLSF